MEDSSTTSGRDENEVDVAQVIAASSTRGFCPQHDGWNLSFYCMQCYTFVCAQCVYKGDHLGHKFKPMKKAIEVVKSTFEEDLTKLADRRTAMREFAARLPGMLPTLRDERDRANKVIKSRLSVLRDCLSKRKEAMLRDLSKQEAEQHDKLQLEAFNLKNIQVAQLTKRRQVIMSAVNQKNMYDFFHQQYPAALLELSPPVPAPLPLRPFDEVSLCCDSIFSTANVSP